MLKSLARELTPPVVRRAFSKIYKPGHRTYPTFEAAARAARKQYDLDKIISAGSNPHQIALIKTLNLKKNGLPELGWGSGAGLYLGLTYAASMLGRRSLTVVDFGGSYGFHALVCAEKFPQFKMKWAIVEADEIASLARPIEEGWLRVFSNISDAVAWLGHVDLVHSAGTLQYLADPDTAIRDLARIGAPFMLWQRMPFATASRTYVIQRFKLSDEYNGLGAGLPPGFVDYTAHIPCVYLREEELLQGCAGYTVIIRIHPTAANWDNGLANWGAILLMDRSNYG